ncbi:hypothetical protein CYMTET_7910 [Cymbomonas tetramitiformis]|uniref:Adenosine deaminase domain-containing protein n=1 Tax=Cymbomonas tetramitiformis TaxID=36881 RepID=A0AAE0GUP7_9CHLO|nr:hypothetical protein CYMTET_7910 [Cymbomonas tetramitiformis]
MRARAAFQLSGCHVRGEVGDAASLAGLLSDWRNLIGCDVVRTLHLPLKTQDAQITACSLLAVDVMCYLKHFGTAVLQGPEEGFPPQPFKEAYSVALAGGLKSGGGGPWELDGGADSVEGALDCLGAHRLGHGVRAVEGGEQLLARMAQQKVCCDVCPTSNVLLGVSESIAKHQLRALLSSGVPCTISADDPLLFGGVGVADEYEALRNEMQMSDEDLAELARSSFIYSGCPDQALLNEGLCQIDAWLKTTKS